MAFIINRNDEHWYTLRRFGLVSTDPALEYDPGNGHWFNLDSTNPGPQYITKVYLGLFLLEAAQNST